jgi:hypothetical protein
MPHYYFHIRDGEHLLVDDEGLCCDDMDAARFEARASARDLLAQEIRHGVTPDGRKIEITDRDGAVVETVALRDVLYDYAQQSTAKH